MPTPDIPHRFQLDLDVPGTPEQVWHAIATAQGISSWMLRTELEPRPGGAVSFDMGPGTTSHGRVTAFEPGRRFAYEEDWAGLVGQADADVTPLVTEFLIEARSGGTCTVRVVTSAFGTGADWENEFWEEMEAGWAPVLDNLRLYLSHYPGQEAAHMWVGTTLAVPPVAAVAAVRQAMGADEAGDRVEAAGATGRLVRSMERHFLVHLDAPVPGLLSCFSYSWEGDTGMHLQGYLFSDDAPAYIEREQATWQAWLDGVAAEAAPQAAADPARA